MALVPLLSGCRSIPQDVSISSKSSLLAVDVLFPIPLSRDPSLVQVFLVKGPIHGELEELPELVLSSFVKNSRAYLLDPEPGTYSLVAVASAVAAPLDDYPVAGGVTKSTLPGTIANAVIFPAELIHRTRTTVGPGRVAFMGALRVRPGDRINADAVFQDYLQKRIAERIHPGATSRSGLGGWFTMTWMVDLEETTLSNEASDRKSFFDDAVKDLGDSPWAQVIARAAPPREATAARSSAPAPSPRRSPAPIREVAIPEPKAAAAEPEVAMPEPEVATAEPEVAIPEPEVAMPEPEVAAAEPEASTPSPKRRRFPGLPPESPLAEIEFGMSFDEVREIMGDPDDKVDRFTAKAWIPFYTGRGAHLRDWIYRGQGRVVFSLYGGSLEVLDVIYDPDEGK
jgi:hypothetical protein